MISAAIVHATGIAAAEPFVSLVGVVGVVGLIGLMSPAFCHGALVGISAAHAAGAKGHSRRDRSG